MYENYYECLGGMYSKYKKPQGWKSALKECAIDLAILAIILVGVPLLLTGMYVIALSYIHGCNFF